VPDLDSVGQNEPTQAERGSSECQPLGDGVAAEFYLKQSALRIADIHLR